MTLLFDRGIFATRDPADSNGPIYATGAQTGGAMGIFEGVIPAGGGVHWHAHTRETECFHVIEGRFRFWCGDDVFEGGPGATLVAPIHKRHRWENIGDTTGRLLMWVTPGGFERFFSEVEALANPTPGAILEIETRYGIISEILG
ncbi:MAG: cupin domain-containing protein [Devosia sp.]